jgi:hypothetical protein
MATSFVRRTVTVVETVEVVTAAPVPSPVVVEVVQPGFLPAPATFRRGDKVRYAAKGRGFKTYLVQRMRDDGKVQIRSMDGRISFPVEPGKLYHSKF